MMGGRVGDMEVFLRVAEAQTFSGAGRVLGLTPSAVSKLITRIEHRLGVSLFNRSSRGLSLTQEGLLYQHHSQRLVSELDDVERSLTAAARDGAPRTPLRVAASPSFAAHQLVPLLPDFLALNRGLEVDLAVTEAASEILEGHTDVAIRLGPVHDDALRMKKVGITQPRVVASPGYVLARGAPEVPGDLGRHNCLRRRVGRAPGEWSFLDEEGGVCPSPALGNVQSDTAETLRQLAIAGLGLAWLPDFMVARDVRDGRLVALLERHLAIHAQPVSAVFVDHPNLAARVRAFVDFIAERFHLMPGWCAPP